MRSIHIVSAGKTERAYEPLLADFTKRLSREYSLVWHLTKTSDKKSENDFFRKSLNGFPFIVLDEHGEDISSEKIANYLESTAVHSQTNLYFLIGGAYGIDDDLLRQASSVWRFGSITLPHQIARLLLVEQLYRASSINAGSGYHHA